MSNYSQEIVNLIKNFLDDDDWNYDFNDEHGVFNFNLTLKCKLQKASYRIRVRNEDYVVTVSCPMSAQDCKEEMASFLTRANFGMLNGNFEMDFDDGEIRYKTFVNCDETTPGRQTIKDSIYLPASMLDRYSEGILAVIFGTKTAEEAIKMCEDDE